MNTRRFLPLAVVLAMFLAFLGRERTASAYPWMIRHGYTQCASCHEDPAGGGLLSPYGRAQGEILMRMRYASPPDREPTALAEPLLGVLPLPRGLNVGGSLRMANLWRIPVTGETQTRFILMQADLLGQYVLGRVRANGSIGGVDEGGNAAAITRGAEEKLVSRVHWVGVDLGAERELLMRAGRMNVPFGLRSVEHTRFVRLETRTDNNAAQQYGLALDYHRGAVRAGAMGIVGNFAISPDKFRSRGFAAYGEYALRPTLAVGVSSMATHTELDTALLTPAWRHAHGAFARYSPMRSVVVSGEWDFLHTSQPTPGKTTVGGVGLLNIDIEPLQGLHVAPTIEVLARELDRPASLGGWASVWWFFLPHADVRFDAITQSLADDRGRLRVVTALLQLHMYL